MTKKKSRPLCSSLQEFKQCLLFWAASKQEQVCRKALEVRKPSVNSVFAQAFCKEEATDEDARAFITDLRGLTCPSDSCPSSGAQTHKLLSQAAIGLLVDCLWTQSWKKEVPTVMESKKRRVESQQEHTPEQPESVPPKLVNDSSINKEDQPVNVQAGECQDTPEHTSGKGKEEPGSHNEVKAA